MSLIWKSIETYEEARIGNPSDGVTFTLTHYPTCYRRGPWRLLVEVDHGPAHHLWGCFDEADQPMRHYHSEISAREEADLIAEVLLLDRLKAGPMVAVPSQDR